MAIILVTNNGDWEGLAAEIPGVRVLNIFHDDISQVLAGPPKSILMRYWFRSDFVNEDRRKKILGIESELVRKGVRLVNPFKAHEVAYQKCLYYSIIPSAPPFIVDPTIGQLRQRLDSGELSIPFVVRAGDFRDRGQMYLVHSLADFEGLRKSITPPTMVVRYVPDMEGKWHAKCRVYVIGKSIDMAFRIISDNWIVTHVGYKIDGATPSHSSGSTEYVNDLAALNHDFRLSPDVTRDAILTGECLGLEVFSMDILLHSGSHYIIDVNAGYAYLPFLEHYPECVHALRVGHVGRVLAYLDQT